MAEIRVKETGTIKLFESDNTSSVTIASPASLGADRTITLPDGDVTLVAGTMSTSDGITVADQWRLTTSFTGDANPIASNLEQIDTTGQGTIGSAMTESSGVFTFPSTGIYYVKFNVQFYFDGDARFLESAISVASTKVAHEYTFVDNGGEGGTTYTYVSVDTLVDCDDTSVDTVKFSVSMSNQGVLCSADTDKNTTSMTFIRLGDT